MNEEALRSIMTRLALLETRIDRAASADVPYTIESTWTPTFQGSTIAGSFTYTFQYGDYVRIGNWIFLTGRLLISAILVAPTGNLQIGGLPFTAGSDNPVIGGFAPAGVSAITLGAGYTQFGGFVAQATTAITFQQIGSNIAGANIPAGNLGATGGVLINAIYKAA